MLLAVGRETNQNWTDVQQSVRARNLNGTRCLSQDVKISRDRPATQVEINEFRRLRLMESTIHLMAEKGVSGATVRAITTDAGVSHGLIGHYYPSKDDLLVASLKHLFSGVTEDVRRHIDAAGPDPMARLKALPEALFSEGVFTARNRAAFLALWHEIRFNEAVREANRHLYVGYHQRVRALFQAVTPLGSDLDDAVTGLIALSDGLWLEMSIGAGEGDQQKAIRLCHAFIDQQLQKLT
jgi:TetR/AcrR family transcriptional repressor of bet genes